MSLSLNARQLCTLHEPTIINYIFITNIIFITIIGMMLLNVVTYVDSLLLIIHIGMVCNFVWNLIKQQLCIPCNITVKIIYSDQHYMISLNLMKVG